MAFPSRSLEHVRAAGSGAREPVGSTGTIEEVLGLHRNWLTGHCVRMLGSPSEADDAVQETFVRAWRAVDGFEGRSSLRSWLYRIATNVCLDILREQRRRERPVDLRAEATDPRPDRGAGLGRTPVEALVDAPDESTADPADRAVTRESVRRALGALSHLPSRQRAVLILRDVLGWRAREVAELLEVSVASANSALQRARAGLRKIDAAGSNGRFEGEVVGSRLEEYVSAFEGHDVRRLTSLARREASGSTGLGR